MPTNEQHFFQRNRRRIKMHHIYFFSFHKPKKKTIGLVVVVVSGKGHSGGYISWSKYFGQEVGTKAGINRDESVSFKVGDSVLSVGASVGASICWINSTL